MIEKASTVKTFFSHRLTHFVLIALLGLLAYSNTFHVPFQWDEDTFIKQNPFIKDLGYFLDPSRAHGHALYGALKSRYIGYLTFALNYAMGGLDVTGYHVFNLLVHILNAFLVYALARLSFNTPFLKEGALHQKAPFIALFSGLLFVSHPVQTEAVTYIFQRLASLAALFYLLSITAYVKSRLSTGKSSFIFYVISLASAILSMKTKENAFTLPVVIVLFEFLFFAGPVRKRLIRMIPLLLTLLIIPVTLASVHKPAGEIIGNIAPTTRGYSGLSRGDYLLTELPVIITYIRLLFFPVNQNLDYDYPVYRSFLAHPVVLSFLALMMVLFLALILYVRSRTGARDGRLAAFGILWFFITLSVESSIVPIPVVIDEYRLYLPSVGAFLAVVTGAGLMLEKLRKEKFRQIIAAFLFIVPLLFAVMTYARNVTWATKVSLWEDVVRKSPSLAYPHNNLGVAYMEQGRFDDAAREFLSALAIKPDHASAYNNLGLIYTRHNMLNEAEQAFQNALRLKPDYAKAYNNLGVVFARQGRYDAAMKAFQNALRYKSDVVDAYNNIGLLYLREGHFGKAEEYFRRAMKISPEYAKAHYNYGVLLERQGRRKEALLEYRTVLSLNPGYDKARLRLEELSKRR